MFGNGSEAALLMAAIAALFGAVGLSRGGALDAKVQAQAARGTPMPSAQRHREKTQMMIIHPLSGRDLAGLIRIHPATETRIRRPFSLARRGG